MYFDVFLSALNHGPLLKSGQNMKVKLASDSVTQLSDFLVVLKVNFVPDIAYTSDQMERFCGNSKNEHKQKKVVNEIDLFPLVPAEDTSFDEGNT